MVFLVYKSGQCGMSWRQWVRHQEELPFTYQEESPLFQPFSCLEWRLGVYRHRDILWLWEWKCYPKDGRAARQGTLWCGRSALDCPFLDFPFCERATTFYLVGASVIFVLGYEQFTAVSNWCTYWWHCWGQWAWGGDVPVRTRNQSNNHTWVHTLSLPKLIIWIKSYKTNQLMLTIL